MYQSQIILSPVDSTSLVAESHDCIRWGKTLIFWIWCKWIYPRSVRLWIISARKRTKYVPPTHGYCPILTDLPLPIFYDIQPPIRSKYLIIAFHIMEIFRVDLSLTQIHSTTMRGTMYFCCIMWFHILVPLIICHVHLATSTLEKHGRSLIPQPTKDLGREILCQAI